MKQILPFLFFSLLALSPGCKKMDDVYKEFLGDGPIVYIGKADSVQVLAGNGRVQVQWAKQTDPRACKAVLQWTGGKNQMETTLDPDAPTTVLVEGLEEGTVVFKIITYDNLGNCSVPVEASGNVYGPRFAAYLANASITKATLKDSKLTLTLKHPGGQTYQGVEITYVRTDGKESTIFVPNKTTSKVLEAYGSGALQLRAVHLPEIGAIDRFYSAYTQFQP